VTREGRRTAFSRLCLDCLDCRDLLDLSKKKILTDFGAIFE